MAPFIKMPGNDRHGNHCFRKVSNHCRKIFIQIGKTTDNLRASTLKQISCHFQAGMLRIEMRKTERSFCVRHSRCTCARGFITLSKTTLATMLAAIFSLKFLNAMPTAAFLWTLMVFSSFAVRFRLFQKFEGSSFDHDS